MKVGRPLQKHRDVPLAPRLGFRPLEPPLPRRPPKQGSPRGGNPSPHASQAPPGARHGAPGGLRVGQGPRPSPSGARPVLSKSNSQSDSGPASQSPRPPPLGAPTATRMGASLRPAACSRPLPRYAPAPRFALTAAPSSELPPARAPTPGAHRRARDAQRGHHPPAHTFERRRSFSGAGARSVGLSRKGARRRATCSSSSTSSR